MQIRIIFVISRADVASLNIYQHLKEFFPKENFYLTEKETIYCENLDKEINADMFVFLSRHVSQAKIPTLSVHVPGNFGPAEHGGIARKLCIAPALLMRNIFLELNNLNNIGYDVVYEATHHGPYLAKKPCCFVEIGSTKEEWQNKEAGKIVANAVANAVKNFKETKNIKIAIGIGGQHTCSKFNKLALKQDIAFGHVCAKHSLVYLNKEMFNQAIKRTFEEVNVVCLDWKGLGKYKEKIKEILKDCNLEIIKVK